MPVPTYDQFTLPVLDFLSQQSEPTHVREIAEYAANWANLTSEERTLSLPNGREIYKDRVSWALTYLKYPKWVMSPKRGFYQITEEGKQRLNTGVVITASELRPYVPKRKKPKSASKISKLELQEDPSAENLTPLDRIGLAVSSIREELKADLLSRLQEGHPEFFERAVLKTLEVMGYVGSLGQVLHTGKTADGGIDGVLHLDHLGLERVHVQAKRWKGNVGQSTIRDFAGAMDVRGATKGVIVTTSSFTAAAYEYVRVSPKTIRLVNGDELVDFMIDFGVGVSRENKVVIPRIDLDFFED